MPQPTPEHLTDALIEDVEWMLTHGEHPWRIAQRLHLTLGNLARILYRHGRQDLARHFERIGAAA